MISSAAPLNNAEIRRTMGRATTLSILTYFAKYAIRQSATLPCVRIVSGVVVNLRLLYY